MLKRSGFIFVGLIFCFSFELNKTKIFLQNSKNLKQKIIAVDVLNQNEVIILYLQMQIYV